MRRLLLLLCLPISLFATPDDLSGADDSHPPVEVLEGRFKAGEGAEPRPLGELSAYCLGCHRSESEGVGEGSDATIAPRPFHSVGAPDKTHPVDVEYPDGARGYVPASDLDPRLTLVEGRLTCGTCHDLAAADHRVVLPLEQSRLCTACHQQ